ncbi:cysteine peptidase, Clan CA, family C19,putative [Trypanosoma brucei gambiense DAL972]|uniref:Ubiquitin carboxyl-terminal hydrolase n=2 Tax=Trypanosoma brucei TaxID=5691 RepID=D0A1P0_TRYB9|nr:cysteine peptidase, Clan CA, family C19,putative [Trypanosoma brucei gambiense DAL972]RHW68573.1 ubiquitin carboxyl-terminal hydrolase [Trypanosoma brucei equiperdum]CBH15183.1 cysteine peptidase, Clan CA, family C19,putative [Trypanosoma brucei gambiense DAL972]|eukprot:XP_011777448.1 cysteine peptidase, Clan CA, family C19,putative [Trypanosoma brucei gambiense DAL972]
MGGSYSTVKTQRELRNADLKVSPKSPNSFGRGDVRPTPSKALPSAARGTLPTRVAQVKVQREQGQDEGASRAQESSFQALPHLPTSRSQSFSNVAQKCGPLSGTPNTPSTSLYRSNILSPSSTTVNGGVFGSPSTTAIPTRSSPSQTQYLEISGYPVGLENYGNTCYFNAVLQLLYHCSPLRMRMLELNAIYEKKKGSSRFDSSTILALTADLFAKMHKVNNNKKRQKGAPTPRGLLNRVRQLNSMFNNNHQHDAHEFAMFLLNELVETESHLMSDERNRTLFMRDEGKESKTSQWFSSLWSRRQKETKKGAERSQSDVKEANESCTTVDCLELPRIFSEGEVCAMKLPSLTRLKSSDFSDGVGGTSLYSTSGWDWGAPPSLEKILTGQFVSLTGCCECENVSVTREAFIDIGLNVMQGSSLRRCVEELSVTEVFDGENKMNCERCGKKVAARRAMWINRLPEYALLVHLKRFHYDEKTGKMRKRSEHIALPREIDVVEYEPCGEKCNEAAGDGSFCCEEDTSGPEFRRPLTSSPVQSTLAGIASSNDAGCSNSCIGSSCGDINSTTTTSEPHFRLLQKLHVMPRCKGRFALSGFVAHRGSGLSSGHYFTCVRHESAWRCFDDNNVTELTDREMQRFWGTPVDLGEVVTTTTAYLLLYERVA